MIVVVSCCNLFLVARVRFVFTLTLCAEFVSPVAPGRVCVSRFAFGIGICCNLFLVARISQLNCYAFLVSLGICCVSVSVARLRFSFRVSRVERFAFRVSRFAFLVSL